METETLLDALLGIAVVLGLLLVGTETGRGLLAVALMVGAAILAGGLALAGMLFVARACGAL